MLSPTIKVQETEEGEYEGNIVVTDIDGVTVSSELIAKYKLEKKG